MNSPCVDLVGFADGELEEERAKAFRTHLVTCTACRVGLVEALQLRARLSELASHAEIAKPAPKLLGAPTEPTPTPLRPVRPKAKRNRRLAVWIGSIGAAAAAVALLMWPPSKPTNAFAALKARPFDIRLAYPDAAPYRPIREAMRGADGPSAESISYATLDAFQRRDDKYALAIARAVNGEKLTEVTAQLHELDATTSVRSDRAAIEIVLKGKELASRNDNVESVLAELESLKGGNDLAARAAHWNYAIVLSRLDLPFSAAAEFRAIAQEHEAGWSDEARQRAAEQARQGDLRARWDSAIAAGDALVATDTTVPVEVVRRFPGVMRAYFYQAVCAATSRERVLALEPMANELDRLNAQPILGNYVRRVANLDFHRRAPLAAAFAQLLRRVPLTDAARAELTNPNPAPEGADIVMNAMFELDAIAGHLEAFRNLVKHAGDPWFELILAQGEASADRDHNNWLGAEAHLRKAQKLCSPAVNYRCWALALQLGGLYQDLHRVPEAVAVVQAGLRTARSSEEWGQTLAFLLRLADVERFNSSIATVRAYANEALLMSPEPGRYNSAAHLVLAGVAVRDLDGPAARRALDLALRGGDPNISMANYLSAANYLADIGRLDPQPGDLAQLQRWLGKLRAAGTLAPRQNVVADEIEGRLLVESDRAAGIAVLERAITEAGGLAHDANAEKARTGAYSVLAFEAARRGDYARVMAVLAQELDLSPAGPCTVGMVAEDERAVVVVRGNDGQDHAIYQSTRRPSDDIPRVSPELARGLEGCGHVRVMANPMLQGQPRALPATVAWSYTTGTHGRTSSPRKALAGPLAVIVANVTPPDYLQLPPLSPQISDSTPRTIKLSGLAATPAQVLSEMVDASEIQFHTHALVDLGVSDASHLVLSPGPDGTYALTAEAIRSTELRGHPIVVLAACHSAKNARYQHAAWSLPDAFLSVGARAVLAAAATIPDHEAAGFFDRVLERARMGADPAAALRDERVAALASNPSSWAADVLLFE